MTIRVSIQNLEDENPDKVLYISDHTGTHTLSGGQEYQTYLWPASKISIQELIKMTDAQ